MTDFWHEALTLDMEYAIITTDLTNWTLGGHSKSIKIYIYFCKGFWKQGSSLISYKSNDFILEYC